MAEAALRRGARVILISGPTEIDPPRQVELVRVETAAQMRRAVIDACRPYERLKDFPMVARASPELRRKVAEKFADVLGKIGVT